MYTEGILRMSGKSTEVEALKIVISREDDVKLDGVDIHVVAQVIKNFFHELPEPILTFEKYNDFVTLGSKKCDEKEKLVLLRNTISSLPVENIEVLKLLILFLGSIVENSEVNMMTAYNLAVVFAPNLLRPKLESIETVYEQAVITNLVKILIEEYEFIFEIENDGNKLPRQPPSPTASPTAKFNSPSVFSQANEVKEQTLPNAAVEIKTQEKILTLKQNVKKSTEDIRTHVNLQMIVLEHASDKATTVEQAAAIAKKKYKFINNLYLRQFKTLWIKYNFNTVIYLTQ